MFSVFLKHHRKYAALLSDIIFHFQVTSGPEPIDNIEWFKDNDLIRSRPRFTQSSQGAQHSLDIQAVTVDDEGIYKCVLLNNWGIASCSAEVLVEGK